MRNALRRRCMAILSTLISIALPAATAGEQIMQQARVQQWVDECFGTAVELLGDAKAREVWAKASKRPRGGKRGPRHPDFYARMLRIYDHTACRCTPTELRQLTAEIGRAAYAKGFGQSADANR